MAGIVELVTSKEFILQASSVLAAIAGIAVKAYSEIAKKLKKQQEETAFAVTKQIEEQGTKTAEIIGKAVHCEIESALDSHRSVRGLQVSVAEKRLSEYAVAISATAPEMARKLVCKMECGSIEDISEIWALSVEITIVHSGLAMFVKVINKNGFLAMSDGEFTDLINNLSGIPRQDGKKRDMDYDLFKCFSSVMHSHIHKERSKARIAHVEATLDRLFLRQTVSNIMYECLDLSKEYHDTKSERAQDLTDRIKRDMKAGA